MSKITNDGLTLSCNIDL